MQIANRIKFQEPSTRILWLYRSLAIFTALVIPVFRYVLPPDSNDPMWQRFALSGLALAFTFATFVNPYFRARIQLMGYLFALVLTAWMLQLTFFNNIAHEYATSYFIILFCCVVIFRDMRWLLFYFFLNIVATTAMVFTVTETDFNIPLFFSMELCVMGVTFFSVWAGFSEMRTLSADNELFRIVMRASFNSTREGILVTDPKGLILHYNDVFLNIWGHNREVIDSGQPHAGLEHAHAQMSDPKAYREGSERAWANPELEIYDMIPLKDGRYIERISKPLWHKDELLGRLWFYRDITAMKEQENILVEAKQQLRRQNEVLITLASGRAFKTGDLKTAFEEIVRSVTWTVDVARTSIWLSKDDPGTMHCVESYDGITGEFGSEGTIRAAENPHYFAALEEERVLTIMDAARDKLTRTFKIPHARPGRTRSLLDVPIRVGGEVRGVLSAETDGEVRIWTPEEQNFFASIGDLVTVVIEASERKKAEQELQHSLRLLKAIFDTSGLGILVTDDDKKVLDWNDMYLEMWSLDATFLTGATAGEVVRHCIEQLQDATEVRKDFDFLVENPNENQTTIMHFKDGRFLERFTQVLQVSGKPAGRVWFYRDITAQKNHENELVNRNFELDSFVYRASHDLKAPLNSLMGLIDILKGETADGNVLTYLGLMDKSVIKLDTFIRNLTDFSRIQRLEMRYQPVDFEEMLAEIRESLAYMQDSGKVEKIVTIADGPQLYGDSFHIAIVLSNLISNAIKYHDHQKASPEVRVTISVTDDRATIEVQDNGMGIPAAHKDRIFELFFRASNQSFGSGLGLYITRNAVDKMDGQIEMESEEGVGTTFRVELPNHMAKAQEIQEESQESATTTNSSPTAN